MGICAHLCFPHKCLTLQWLTHQNYCGTSTPGASHPPYPQGNENRSRLSTPQLTDKTTP